MAYEGRQIAVSGLVAGEDLSTYQYVFVKLSADGTVVHCSAATDKPIGVLQDAPKNGGAANVCTSGQTKVKAGGSLTAGNSIGTDATGRAAAYTAADTTKYIVGQVVDVSGGTAAGDLVTAVVSCASARTLA